MKTTKHFRLLTAFLTVVMLIALSLNVYAAKSNAVTKDGLTAQLFTDKDVYESGETVKATVQVNNQTGREVFVFVQLNVPEGVKLAGDTTAFDGLLQDGESLKAVTGDITEISNIVSTSGGIAAGSTATGDNMQAGFWVIMTALMVMGLIAMFVYGKNKKTWLSILLCMVMIGSLGVGMVPVQAADINGDIYLSCAIQVDGKAVEVAATVSYVIYDDAEEVDASNDSAESGDTNEPSDDNNSTTDSSDTTDTSDTTDSSDTTDDNGSTDSSDTTDDSSEDSTGGETGGDDEETVAGIKIYVSPSGEDSNAGTLEAPVKTLEQARALVRAAKAADATMPVYVYLRGGEYVLTETFTLTAEDSGTEEAPVTWRAYEDEEVIVTGSKSLDFSKFVPVEGEMKELLSEEAQNKVVVASATELGIDPITINLIEDGLEMTAPIVTMDGHGMVLTRYPNTWNSEEWMRVESATNQSGNVPVTLKIEEEMFWDWSYRDEDYLYIGQFQNGWNLPWFYATRDAEKQTVSSTGNVFYGADTTCLHPTVIFNAYESIDEPGEWYYDKGEDKLYLYPYEDATADSTLYVSSECDFDLISMTGTSYISIEGLTITNSDKRGVVMDDVDSCVLNNCSIVGFGDRALNIENAYDSGVRNSEVAYTRIECMLVDGGDIENLTPGNNFVSNNRIHDANTYKWHYSQSIRLRGVNTKLDHNEIYNMPTLAVGFANSNSGAVDLLIEHNIFHNCLKVQTDTGVIYGGVAGGRAQGTIVQYNHFYDIGSGSTEYHDVYCVYPDDGANSVTVTNNIFGPFASEGVGAMLINSGHNHVFKNNLLIDLAWAAEIAGEAAGAFETKATGSDLLATDVKRVWTNTHYTTRWPWLTEAYEYVQEGKTGEDFYIKNVFKDNILIQTDTWVKNNGRDALNIRENLFGVNDITRIVTEGNVFVAKEAYENTRNLFTDYDNGDYRLTEEFLQAQNTGFTNIDQSEMGLQYFTYDGVEQLPGSHEPVVTDVTISGTIKEGETVTALYTFTDVDGDAECGTLVDFYIADSETEPFYASWDKVNVASKTNQFTVTEECEGKWLRCKVTAVDENGAQADSVWSDPVFVPISNVVTDKSALTTLVAESKALLEDEGIASINSAIFKAKVDALEEAIAAAEVTLAKDPLSSLEYTQATDTLTEAKQSVKTFADAYLSKEDTGNAKTVDVAELIADKANWVTTRGSKPVFGDNSMTIAATDAQAQNVYLGKKYSNTVFHFTYKHDLTTGEEWPAIKLDMSSEGSGELYTASVLGPMLVFKQGYAELQVVGKERYMPVLTNDAVQFENGKEYDITFGMYNIDEGTVKIIATVDGEVIFNELYEDITLVDGEYYFCTRINKGVTSTLCGSDYSVVTLDNLITDQNNWITVKGAAPTFDETSITMNAVDTYIQNVYTGKKYTNTVFRFKYTHNIAENGWPMIKLDATTEGKGLESSGGELYVAGVVGPMLVFKENFAELQLVGKERYWTGNLPTNDAVKFESGKEYDVTFGIYDIDEKTVRIVATVDGEYIFDERVEDETLVGKAYNFCTRISKGTTSTLSWNPNVGYGIEEEKAPGVYVEDYFTKDTVNCVATKYKTAGSGGTVTWTQDGEDGYISLTQTTAGSPVELHLYQDRFEYDLTKPYVLEVELRLNADEAGKMFGGYLYKDGGYYAAPLYINNGRLYLCTETGSNVLSTSLDSWVKVRIVGNPTTGETKGYVYENGDYVYKATATTTPLSEDYSPTDWIFKTYSSCPVGSALHINSIKLYDAANLETEGNDENDDDEEIELPEGVYVDDSFAKDTVTGEKSKYTITRSGGSVTWTQDGEDGYITLTQTESGNPVELHLPQTQFGYDLTKPYVLEVELRLNADKAGKMFGGYLFKEGGYYAAPLYINNGKLYLCNETSACVLSTSLDGWVKVRIVGNPATGAMEGYIYEDGAYVHKVTTTTTSVLSPEGYSPTDWVFKTYSSCAVGSALHINSIKLYDAELLEEETSNPSPSPDPSPSIDPSPSPDPSPSIDPSPSPDPSPSIDPSPSPDPSPSIDPSPEPSPSTAPTIYVEDDFSVDSLSGSSTKYTTTGNGGAASWNEDGYVVLTKNSEVATFELQVNQGDDAFDWNKPYVLETELRINSVTGGQINIGYDYKAGWINTVLRIQDSKLYLNAAVAGRRLMTTAFTDWTKVRIIGNPVTGLTNAYVYENGAWVLKSTCTLTAMTEGYAPTYWRFQNGSKSAADSELHINSIKFYEAPADLAAEVVVTE